MTKSALLIVLLLITVYSRFINLNWDFGWGFHPDENNLWGASRRVELFSKLDPEFYAYGGFPIYLYSLLGSKVEARAVSAGAQVLIVILLFIIGRRIVGFKGGFFAAAMATFSAGLMQAGRFLTVESLLGLFSLLLIFILPFTGGDSVSNLGIRDLFWLVLAGVILGLGVATKASFIIFVLPILVVVLRSDLWKPKVRPYQIIRELAKITMLLVITILVFLLTNPFIFSKWNEVKSTLEYEAKVATGNLPVFYTREFLGTVSGWFQAIHVFPQVTGWLFLPMFFIGALVVLFKVRPRRTSGSDLLILLAAVVSALLSFLPFWAKWTRYVVQVLPILILVAGIGAGWIWEKGKTGKAIVVAAMISFLLQFFSTLSVYANEDTRVAAAKWAEQNISKDAKIFTEAMDLGILPFNPTFGQNIKLFNFYELDEVRAEEKQRKLDSLIQESDYFILLSRRVYKNSLDHSDKFPRAAKFYQRLFDGSIGYKQIYTPRRNNCSLFTVLCSLFFAPEETFEVFDNPHLMIFQKKL